MQGIFYLFHACDSCTHEAVLFQNIFKFSNILPFSWKIACMPLLSRIGPVMCMSHTRKGESLCMCTYREMNDVCMLFNVVVHLESQVVQILIMTSKLYIWKAWLCKYSAWCHNFGSWYYGFKCLWKMEYCNNRTWLLHEMKKIGSCASKSTFSKVTIF